MIKIYRGVKFCSLSEFIKVLGGEKHRKLFGYLLYTLGLIPRPIKVSRGRGVEGLFPEFVLEYFTKVVAKRRKGLGYREIDEKLKPEKEEMFAKDEALKRQFKLEDQIALQLRSHLNVAIDERNKAVHGQDIIIKDKNSIIIIESKMQEIKNELKIYCSEWDGQSISMLNRIRFKIDELETLQAREKVVKAVSQEA